MTERDEAWRSLALDARLAVAGVVLDCLRPERWAATSDAARGWSPAHWSAARLAVQVHGIGPLLHRTFDRPAPASLEPLFAYATATADLNRRRSARWCDELERVIDVAARRGLDVVALKGAALVASDLDDPVLRPTADIDLLVSGADVAGLDSIWRDAGFEFERASTRHRAYYLRTLGPAAVHSCGEHPDNPLRLELHPNARQEALGFAFDVTAAIQRRRELVSWRSVRMSVPGRAPLFQHVGFHAAQDLLWRKGRLLKLRDVALLAAGQNDDHWRDLTAAAATQHAERFFFVVLVLAARHAEARIPPAVLQELRTRTPPSLLRHVDRAPLSALSHLAVDRQVGALGGLLAWTFPGTERWRLARRLALPTTGELRDIFGEDPAITRRWYYGRAIRRMVGA
jgi:hypothetical protein